MSSATCGHVVHLWTRDISLLVGREKGPTVHWSTAGFREELQERLSKTQRDEFSHDVVSQALELDRKVECTCFGWPGRFSCNDS